MVLLSSFFVFSIFFLQSTNGQFTTTDGTNDLFALFTQCPIEPRYPPDNQYFCYRTDVRMLSGFTLCQPRFVRQRAVSVGDRTDTYTVYYINTPGRLRGANYVNRLLCRWNIRCSPGQLMYYDFPEHDVEQRVTSPFFLDPICIDFLKVSRDFGDFTTCGTNPPSADLEPSKLLVEFRSNRRIRSPGFRMRAICFDPTTQDATGCTTTTGTGKRDTEEIKEYNFETLLTQKESDILNNMVREKRNPHSATNENINVDIEAKVVYSQRTLTVLLKQKIQFRFTGIDSLHTYNEFKGVISYYADILGNRTLTFRGFGVLLVVENICYYVLFGANPRFLPNDREKRMIRTLLNAEEALVVDEDFILPAEDQRMATGNSGHATTNRDKRQVSGATNAPTFSPDVVAMAQSAQNSCNAVLKAAAQSILNNL